jgi:hypothetical protein
VLGEGGEVAGSWVACKRNHEGGNGRSWGVGGGWGRTGCWVACNKTLFGVKTMSGSSLEQVCQLLTSPPQKCRQLNVLGIFSSEKNQEINIYFKGHILRKQEDIHVIFSLFFYIHSGLF